MAFKYTEEQLNTMDKSLLVSLFLGLQEQLNTLTEETRALNDKMQVMMEQLILQKDHRFGRSSEKLEDTTQVMFMEVDGKIVFFNEAEAVSDLDAEEPEDLEVKPKRGKKTVGKKEQDLSGLTTNIIEHYMTDDELVAEFGKKGWKQLPDAISKRYKFIPAMVEVCLLYTSDAADE